MAGATIEVQIDDAAVIERLQRLSRIGDVDPALEDFGTYLLDSHEFRFQLEVSPEGEPWELLNPAYRRRKLAAGGPDRILTFSGDLRETLRYQVGGGELRFGTDRPYGATHQFGDFDRGIPARPFLGLSEDDEAELADILQAHLDRLADG
jgi:phage virion morphogenesis protein